MKRNANLLLLILVLFSFQSCDNQQEQISDSQFPGGKLPGDEPELFAPGIVTGHYQTRDIAISPDGTEMYFAVRISTYYSIMVMKKTDGVWSEPKLLENMEDPKYMNVEPALSWDGNKFYWLSNRPVNEDEEMGGQDIWVMDRVADGWGEPYNLGEPVNTEMAEFYPSLTKDGTMYFTRNDPGSPTSYIYRCRFIDGAYQEAEKLPEQVNCGKNHFNAFIAHDESYLIVPVAGHEETVGGTDYFIVFRTEDDKWSKAINMGDKINTRFSLEFSAYVSRDGKYLFFMSARLQDPPQSLSYNYLKELASQPESGNPSIYWMNASIIDSLRQTAVFE